MSLEKLESKITDLESIVKGGWHSKGISGEVEQNTAKIEAVREKMSSLEVITAVNCVLTLISVVLSVISLLST